MKTKLISIVLIVLTLIICSMVTGCNKNTDTGTSTITETETSTNTDTNDETNTATGSNTSTNTDIPVHEHTEEIIPAVEPTCTEAGLTKGKKCSECGEILVEQAVVDAFGHTEIIITATEPTCTKVGLTEGKKCSICGEILVDQKTVDALGHTNEIIPAVEPTCTKAGLTEGAKCSVCGEIIVEQETVDALGHKYNNYFCTVCGDAVATSEGLSYSLGSDGTYYEVTGRGNCNDIDIVIPNIYKGLPVTKINSRAFNDCKNIKSIIMLNGMLHIGGSSFSNCTSLESITIPESVVSIGDYAFSGCSALKSIQFNASNMKNLNSSNYVFYNSNKTAEIKLTIGKNVTRIPSNLFSPLSHYNETSTTYYCNITEVVFEEGSVCESIGNAAFASCKNLSKIELPTSLTSIESYAFANCHGLENVDFPSSITSIGAGAFYKCTHLTTLTLPETITELGKEAFSNCYMLSVINYNIPALNNLSNSNKIFVLAGQDTDGLTVNIGANVTKIPDYLFSPFTNASSPHEAKLINVTFENGSACQSIGKYAFYNCSLLESINIPNSITNIGEYAFYNCSNLKNVSIPSSLTSINEYTFYNCANLESISIHSAITRIENYAFGSCTNIKSVYIEDLKAWCNISFGSWATPLYYGADLYLNNNIITSLTFSDDISSINACAFQGCTSITNVSIPSSIKEISDYAFKSCTNLKSVSLSNGITSIGRGAFAECSSITSISLPSTINTISDYAFDGCSGLSAVHITDLASWCAIKNESNPLEYAHNLYLNDNLITELVIPDGVTTINTGAFSGCFNLTSVSIPSSITSINGDAFKDCTSIKAVYITDLTAWCNISFGTNSNPLSYGENLYLNEVLVTTLKIPNGITSLKTNVFRNATCITELILPESVTNISSYAFYGCSNIKSINIPSKIERIRNNAFDNCTSVTELYYNAISMEDLSNWAFTSFGVNAAGVTVIVGNTVERIPANLFNTNTTDTTPKIIDVQFEDNSSLTSIGKYAFYNCTNLTSISIPNSVTDIGDMAFAQCGLTSITLPNSIVTLGISAFNCENMVYNEYDNAYYLGTNNNPYLALIKAKDKSITSCIINDNTSMICSSAFTFCTSLESITISENITSIGNSAFNNCTSLTEIKYNVISLDDLTETNYIFNKAGQNGNGITVTIGKNVTMIPAYLFCPSYSNTSFTPKITSVCFENDSVCESIGDYAFYYSSLVNMEIPSSIKTIGDYSFYSCSKLTSIVIPVSVTDIGEYAFKYCNAITIYCEAISKPSDWNSRWNPSSRPIYWYSEEEPTTEGNYWHYVDGEVVVW
ncbi:MAG: leucine-rich repeat protein [Clostridia bacterium]|nr:leucine-rich repeat protein [Clostridia bacterium]